MSLKPRWRLPAVVLPTDPAARRLLHEQATEVARRRRACPMGWSELWHHEEPRTSQRRALLPLMEPGVLMACVLGGNRSGKSMVAAQFSLASAAGLDAVTPWGSRWVERWLSRNALPLGLIKRGPGRVWVGSPTFGSAVEQIRPHLRRWAPEGSRFTRWNDKQAEGELTLPSGGVIVSKAYRQYDGDPQSWEGANIRDLLLDEQPNSRANLTAGLSRLIDQSGRVLMALTPLRGTADWLYRDLVRDPPSWMRVTYLHGADNPHIPQDRRQLMLSSVPEWQRASRDVGAFTAPEGAVYSVRRGVHTFTPRELPQSWTRWVGVDWGGRAPHVLWAAEDPHGTLWVYRELAPRRTTLEPAVSARRLIAWAIEMETQLDGGLGVQQQVYRVADSEDPGAIVDAAEQGWGLIPAAKGAGSVLRGIELTDALLQTADPVTGEEHPPRIMISTACPLLLEELEGLRWAEVREGADPRPDPACPDHGPDALRYIVQCRESMGYR